MAQMAKATRKARPRNKPSKAGEFHYQCRSIREVQPENNQGVQTMLSRFRNVSIAVVMDNIGHAGVKSGT